MTEQTKRQLLAVFNYYLDRPVTVFDVLVVLLMIGMMRLFGL